MRASSVFASLSDKLLSRLQNQKVTEETKDLVEQALIYPFIKKSSLKALGDGIDILSDKLIFNQGEDLTDAG